MIEVQAQVLQSGRFMDGGSGNTFQLTCSIESFLAFRSQAMGFGRWLMERRDHSPLMKLANSDFEAWMAGFFRDLPLDLEPTAGVHKVWKDIVTVMPLAHGVIAAAPLRYRLEKNADWTYLDGINDMAEPLKASKPRKKPSPSTIQERKVKDRLREAGFTIE